MLARLTIQDVVLIDKLTIELSEGLNVFTGETGAGKSIVLDSLSLALGGRADAALIRAGAGQASVTAEFTFPLPTSLHDLFQEQGIEPEDPLILRRLLSKDGKSRAFVNDQPISIGLLKRIGETLLEIHGQFDTHGLLDVSMHGVFLDAFANLQSLRAETATAFENWQAAADKEESACKLQHEAEAEESYLQACVQELSDLAVEEGESDRLADRRKQLQNSGKIAEAMQSSINVLSGERGAVGALVQVGKNLARITDQASDIKPILEMVDRLASEAQEAAQDLNAKLSELEASPNELDKIEERLFALRALARKHNVQPDDLSALLKGFVDKLALVGGQGMALRHLSEATKEMRNLFVKQAEKLSAKRKTAAKSLAQKVMKELPPLKLERACFEVDVTPLAESQWGANGMDRVSFLASANPGQETGSLQKVASGGELSRFMLALKIVLASADLIPVLVFDEVDAGVGGATASAVGERLARLGQNVQILVVTHSPQVAARGNRHWRIEKIVKSQKAGTRAIDLDHAARIEEIARMISGAHVTEAARQAAQTLLQE